jgi:hypothetical protein
MIKQLSFASFDENFAMLQKIQPQLLQLLEDFIDITELIPFTWSLNYYKDTGRRHRRLSRPYSCKSSCPFPLWNC